MSDAPAQPQERQEALWDEDKIVDWVQAHSSTEPQIDIYNQVEWVRDDFAIGLALDVLGGCTAALRQRDGLIDEIAKLRAAFLAAVPAAYDHRFAEMIGSPWSVLQYVIEHFRDMALPAPDWSQAPEWARWWVVEANGDALWYQYEPQIQKVYVTQHSWTCRIGKVNIIEERVDIPLGVDWRLLKCRRAAQTEDTQP